MSTTDAAERRRARAQETTERILAIGTRVLEEDGWEGFTAAAVAQRAGVSVGTIYNRFENKRALVLAIHERYLHEVISAQATTFDAIDWSQMSTPELIRTAVLNVADAIEPHSNLLRVFILRGLVDEEIARRATVALHQQSSRFAAVLLARSDEFRATQSPLEAADLCYRMIYGVLSRRVVYGPAFETLLETDWDTVVEGLAEACTAYLIRQ